MMLIGVCLVVILSIIIYFGLWWKGVSNNPDFYAVPSVDTLMCNNEIVFPIKNDKDALCFAFKDKNIQTSMREKEKERKYFKAWEIKTTYNEIEKNWHIQTKESGFIPLTCNSYFTESGEAIKTRTYPTYFDEDGNVLKTRKERRYYASKGGKIKETRSAEEKYFSSCGHSK